MAGHLDLLDVRKGVRYYRTVTLQQRNGAPVPQSGDVPVLRVSKFWEDDEVMLQASLGSGLVDIDLSLGRFAIDLPGAITDSLEASPYEGWVYRLDMWPGGVEADSWGLMEGRIRVKS
jgi:hypothetical protein